MENLESEIIQNAVNGLIKKLDGLMIEGLELKGFKFENQTFSNIFKIISEE